VDHVNKTVPEIYTTRQEHESKTWTEFETKHALNGKKKAKIAVAKEDSDHMGSAAQLENAN
jgi:hypothetical protein